MRRPVNLPTYLANTRVLGTDSAKFRCIIERQRQFRVLPGLSGSRAVLEPELWELLVFCLDGHDAPMSVLDDPAYERAHAAVIAGQSLVSEGAASFPRAARAVLDTMNTLREFGIYPPPVLKS